MAAAVAFAFGVVSFVSPCVLPLVPAYLSFVSGVSIQDMKEMSTAASLRRVGARAGAFILGFSIVYTVLGAFAGAASPILRVLWFRLLAGVLLVVLGFHLTGLLKIGALHRERRFHLASPRAGILGAFVVGIVFAFGWSPCTGPIVGMILVVAAAQETVTRGVFLLALYSLGLGIPLFISAIAVNRFVRVFGRLKRWLGAIEIASGVIVIAVGVWLAFGPLRVVLSSLFE